MVGSQDPEDPDGVDDIGVDEWGIAIYHTFFMFIFRSNLHGNTNLQMCLGNHQVAHLSDCSNPFQIDMNRGLEATLSDYISRGPIPL